jgi:CRP-like cAMP-binding protein
MKVDPWYLLRQLELSEKMISELFPLCEVRGFQAGDVINFESSIFHRAPFFVLSGLVSIRFKNGNAVESILNIYGPKTLLGEAVFFDAFDATEFRCETAVRVLALPTKEILVALSKERLFGNHLTKLSYWRYKHGECNRNVNKTKDPFLRVTFLLSHFVFALSHAHSYQDDGSTGLKNNELKIPINQSVLANHFDISRTIFSQSLQKLESNGWLQLRYGYINFLNLPLWFRIYRTHQKNELTDLEPFKTIASGSGHLGM